MPATYDSIATYTTNGSTITYTFSSIPATYSDLVLVINDINSTGNFDTALYFNGDTGTNYSRTGLRADGATASSFRQTNLNSIQLCSDGAANYARPAIVHILNYANTAMNKIVVDRVNTATTGTSAHAQLWRNTAAINQVQVFTSTAMAAGGTISLYGIKAA